MAISLGFGVLFATLITLALVPSIYLIVEDLRRILKAAGGRRVEASAGSAGGVGPSDISTDAG
jgi:hypothetical protein